MPDLFSTGILHPYMPHLFSTGILHPYMPHLFSTGILHPYMPHLFSTSILHPYMPDLFSTGILHLLLSDNGRPFLLSLSQNIDSVKRLYIQSKLTCGLEAALTLSAAKFYVFASSFGDIKVFYKHRTPCAPSCQKSSPLFFIIILIYSN